MLSFTETKGLDTQHYKDILSFPIRRETLITKDSDMDSGRELVIDEETNAPLGIVKRSRPVIPYTDVIGWMEEGMESLGIDYKLRDSVKMGNGDMYQEYIFDSDIDSPDGNSLAPMILVRGSYVRSPLQIDFGTFRFVCSNGAKVGEVVDSIKISASNTNFLQSSLKESFQISLKSFAQVAKLYQKLQDQPMDTFLHNFCMNEAISACYKRAILLALAEAGDVSILVDKIKKEDLLIDPDSVYKIANDQNAWVLYNVITQVATHQARSVARRTSLYSKISKAFNI